MAIWYDEGEEAIGNRYVARELFDWILKNRNLDPIFM